MLIGTAGHIDHGKTSLLQALTGVATDRLPEEKARGMTLDLGYAYTALADGRRLGFIDVPGHEKLIHNALAGLTGIDHALLVVAADDGPMPQTREHLEVLDLLGLSAGTVALTKRDRVDAARLAEVEAEIQTLLADTTLAGSPIYPVSAPHDEGIAELKAHLETMAARWPARASTGLFRLAIDRCFSLSGIGTVVTGTVHAGRIELGDQVLLSPSGLPARVRGLHVQGQASTSGQAGDRCALALTGDFKKTGGTRGQWLIDAALHHPLTRFQAEVRCPTGAPPLRHWQAIHLHLGTLDLTGRVVLLDREKLGAGETALAEIQLDRETLAMRGDRFILRDASARRTLAGGRVLDGFPPTRRKRDPDRLAMLAAMRDNDPAVALTVASEKSPAGVDLKQFAANWNLDANDMATLTARLALKTANGDSHAFSPATWQALQARVLVALQGEHERAPDMAGVAQERLRRMSLASLAPRTFDSLIGELQAEGRIVRTRAWLHLPAHQAVLAASDRELLARLAPRLDATPFNPPRVRDLARATGMPEDELRQACQRLARAGELYPVAHDHYFTVAAIGALADNIAELSGRHGCVRAAEFRDVIYSAGQGGRKVAIQILEFFDRIGYTRRVRDEHILRQPSVTHPWKTA